MSFLSHRPFYCTNISSLDCLSTEYKTANTLKAVVRPHCMHSRQQDSKLHSSAFSTGCLVSGKLRKAEVKLDWWHFHVGYEGRAHSFLQGRSSCPMPPRNASFVEKPTKATVYKTPLQALWDRYPSTLASQECFILLLSQITADSSTKTIRMKSNIAYEYFEYLQNL